MASPIKLDSHLGAIFDSSVEADMPLSSFCEELDELVLAELELGRVAIEVQLLRFHLIYYY